MILKRSDSFTLLRILLKVSSKKIALTINKICKGKRLNARIM